MTIDWPEWRALPASPALAPLRDVVSPLPRDRWPDHADWTRQAERLDLRNARGRVVRFVAPTLPPLSALAFEDRVLAHGEIETRPASWHDAFHACAWLGFPLSKARINALHVADGLDDSPNRRSVLRNLLTLIDEGGLIVASARADLLGHIRAFAWHALFWRERDGVMRDMDFVIFGHALYERALDMHHGCTGRGVLFEVGRDYFGLGPDARRRYLDQRLAALLDDAGRLTSTSLVQPVPIKGIPGWAAENLNEDYYFDTSQFCTGRRAAGKGVAAC